MSDKVWNAPMPGVCMALINAARKVVAFAPGPKDDFGMRREPKARSTPAASSCGSARLHSSQCDKSYSAILERLTDVVLEELIP